MGKKILSAADILAADDMKLVEVDVPEWGGTVYLRPLSALEALELRESDNTDRKHSAMKLTFLCCCNEDGSQMFTNEDVEKLSKKSLSAMLKIQKVAMQINGLSGGTVEAVKND